LFMVFEFVHSMEHFQKKQKPLLIFVIFVGLESSSASIVVRFLL
jgi:hypothetical protein